MLAAAEDTDIREWEMSGNACFVEITGDRVAVVNEFSGQETSLDRAVFADVLGIAPTHHEHHGAPD